MEISIKHEMVVFWSAFLCAQIICILFDFFRVLRQNIPHNKTFVAIEDIVFCTLSFKIFSDTCYITNNGKLRWFIFASMAGSAILYFFLETKLFIKIFSFIFKITRLILTPFIKITILLKKFFTKLFSGVKTRILAIITAIKRKIGQFVTKRHSNPLKTRE